MKKKTSDPALSSTAEKKEKKKRLWGIQSRVSWTFFLFIVLMVALLWLLQIQLLDQFYRYEKRRTLQNVSALSLKRF